jgi:rhamnosyltransferase
LPQEIYDLDLRTSHTPPHSASCALVIPTCNAAPHWDRLCAAINSQNIAPDQVLIIDSTSDDETRALAQSAGYRLVVIPRASFRHGATRALAAALLPETEFLIYLTQDAIPYDGGSLVRLMECFQDPLVGAAYGRQLPRRGADAIERHARLFNYPGTSAVRDFASRATLGFRAACCSNSFAAYRRVALEAVGGFPDHVIMAEDVSVVARMLIAGWKVAYNAEACVYHSHHLSLPAEFSRYFDIAVHHNQERWIIDCFGSVGGEGLHFVQSELKYLWKNAPQLIPLALLRTLAKWVAYQSGQRQHLMPLWLKRAFSAHPSHWNEQHQGLHTATPVVGRTGDETLRKRIGSELKSGR